MTVIKTIELPIALKDCYKPQEFKVIPYMDVPEDYVSSPFYVTDRDLTEGYIIIGLPVLRHLQVDKSTIIENNYITLNGTDCADVGCASSQEEIGHIGRIMTTRLKRQRLNMRQN